MGSGDKPKWGVFGLTPIGCRRHPSLQPPFSFLLLKALSEVTFFAELATIVELGVLKLQISVCENGLHRLHG